MSPYIFQFHSQRYAGFDAEIPSEWEAWLRHRRDEPPTDEQVQSDSIIKTMLTCAREIVNDCKDECKWNPLYLRS